MRDGAYALQSRNSSLQSADASHYRSSGVLTHQQLHTIMMLWVSPYPNCTVINTARGATAREES